MKALPLVAVLLIFLTSCSSIKPNAPDLPQSQINSTPLPDSKIDLPVTIDLSQVFNDFTASIPLELSGEGSAGPAQYRWQMQRQPFDLSLSGDSVNIIDAAHFSGGGYIKNPLNGKLNKVCSCDVDATIGIHTNFNMAADYSLSGNASLTQFDLNACNLKVANFNITPLLKARATDAINHALAGLNQKINQYNFRQVLQPEWNALSQPIKIGDIGYVVINPSAIRLSPPTGSGHTLDLEAGVTAKPVFYLNNPGKVTASVIPNITASDGNGFNLNMDVHLDYNSLNSLLKSNVENKKITDGAKSYLVIMDAAIYGTGSNHLLIKVKFTGKQGAIPYHGILYFTCIPVYDINTGNFYINEIDFDVNTITMLREGPAAWILNSAVKKYLGSQVHFNVGAQINGIKDKLNQSINRQIGQHVALSGNVDSISLQGILPLKDYILVRVSTAGNLAVKVD